MMGKYAIIFAVICSAIYVTAEEEHVITLTKDNFEVNTADGEIMLVKFYAPWCGHCKKLAPFYEEAAKILKEKGSKVKLGKVDATQEGDIATKYGIGAYPTLKLFRGKEPEEYTGGRTTDTIVSWLEMITGPSVYEAADDAEVEKLASDPAGKVSIIGKFGSKDAEKFKMFEKVASELRSVGRFIVFVKEGNSDTISVRRHEEDAQEYSGEEKLEDFKTFVKHESFPLFGPINGENFKEYAERGLDVVWFAGSETEYNENKETIRKTSKEFRKDYSFVWLDTDQFKQHAENMLGLTVFPGLVLQTKRGRYVLPTAVESLKSSDTVITFFNDVKAEKIERSLKSDPVPMTNEEPVKVVVGTNFEELVLTKDKDVMLEVYAPWCGHCKNFEKVYTEIATKMASFDHLVFAKMDGTTNESPVEDFEWKAFPSIFFIKAGEKIPIRYEGNRGMEDVLEFVKKHSSTPIELPVAAEKEEL